MMIGWAMSLLDVSIVNITIPELQDELSTDIATVTWVVNAYNIVFAVLLVSMGRLADQFGRKRFFIIGLTVFTIGSGAVRGRLVGGVADRLPRDPGHRRGHPRLRSASRSPCWCSPPPQRGRGLALIAVVALISSAAGPVIGGALVEIAQLALDLPHQHPVRDPRRDPLPALVARDLGPHRRPGGGRSGHGCCWAARCSS